MAARGARPGLPILLDDVDLLEVETGILGRVEVLSQSEILPPKAATPRRVSASMSPSRYLRSFIILRLLECARILPEERGRDHPLLLAPAFLSLLRRFASRDRIGHPPAPLSIFSLVADAAPERSVGGELGAVGRGQLLSPLSLHPGP